MATNNGLDLSLLGQTGTGAVVGSVSPTLVSPLSNTIRLSNSGILDNNGVSMLTLQATASAVNNISVVNNIAGQRPYFIAQGSDSNIVLTLEGKGTGGVEIRGTHTNDQANIGYVGEEIESVVLTGAPVSFTSGVTQDLTSISLTAGDWDVYSNIGFTATTVTFLQGWVNTTSNSAPDSAYQTVCSPLATGTRLNLVIPTRRLLLSTTTTIYLSGGASSTGTLTGYGYIWARRAR